MANKKRFSNQSSNSPQLKSNPSNGHTVVSPSSSPSSENRNDPSVIASTTEHLPPKREGRKTRRVTAPLYKSTRLSTFIYILVLLTTLLLAYYAWRLVQYKSAVGGWWSLLLGRKPPGMVYGGTDNPTQTVIHQHQQGRKGLNQGEASVENHIKALAEALGMPTTELAAAIAAAVRAYVPPASLSSVKAQETGEAVKVMLEEPGKDEGGPIHQGHAEEHHGGVVEGIVEGFDTFVGMDEP